MDLDYKVIPIRSAAILTGSYVAGTIINSQVNLTGENQLMVNVQFTLGSLTDGRVKIEFSNDGTNYYQETFASISGGVETDSLGVHVMTATGNYRIPVPIKDRYIKISALGTGTATGSSMAIEAVVGTS